MNDFTRPEDKVLVPEPAADGTPEFTAPMPGNQQWKMFEDARWLAEIQQKGFFGGTGKLFCWIDGQPQPGKPAQTFRIGGKNPDPQRARTFIDAKGGTQFWYAYAIARHETFGRVRENGAIRYYNQFYTDYQGGPIGDASVDMGWAAWAKGWPIYNLDRGSRNGSRYQNGPGGYGVYQLTWGPKLPTDTQGTGSNAFIPRKMIWNWQDNVNGAIAELQGKLPAATALRDGLQASHSQWPGIPSEGSLSGLESIVVTYYNGTGGLPREAVNSSLKQSPWKAEKNGSDKIWQFHQNSQRYVESVNSRINNNKP